MYRQTIYNLVKTDLLIWLMDSINMLESICLWMKFINTQTGHVN